jgi:hypothetical protein
MCSSPCSWPTKLLRRHVAWLPPTSLGKRSQIWNERVMEEVGSKMNLHRWCVNGHQPPQAAGEQCGAARSRKDADGGLRLPLVAEVEPFAGGIGELPVHGRVAGNLHAGGRDAFHAEHTPRV